MEQRDHRQTNTTSLRESLRANLGKKPGTSIDEDEYDLSGFWIHSGPARIPSRNLPTTLQIVKEAKRNGYELYRYLGKTVKLCLISSAGNVEP